MLDETQGLSYSANSDFYFLCISTLVFIVLENSFIKL